MARQHKSGQELNQSMRLSMGINATEFGIIVNLTPTLDGLERRPNVVPLDMSFAYPTVTGTDADDLHQVGKYDTEIDLAASGNEALYGSRLASTFTLYNRVMEGVDCEIINGRIVAVHLTRTGSTKDLVLGYSWHWPGDTLLGSDTIISSGGRHSSVALIETDYGNGAGAYTDLHQYHAARYWERRIVQSPDVFMIAGYGVGGSRFASTAVTKTQDADSIPIWNATNLLMDQYPTDVTYGSDDTTIPRVDASSQYYISHGPREAMAHVDRLGQTFWYGFRNVRYNFDGVAPAANLLIDKSDVSLSAGDSGIILRPYDIMISEELLPQSLNLIGLFPLNQASGASDEIVGMAEGNGGTTIFTRNSIQAFNGIGSDRSSGSVRIISQSVGAESRHSIKSVDNTIYFANTDGLFMLQEQRPLRITAFDRLFREGVEVERGPYSTYQGDADGSPPGQTEMVKNETHQCQPWQNYKIDHSRLDRAVAGVWNELYILFCSMTTHKLGDDNRLGLVYNTVTGASTVWLLPQHMGVRGFAYNGDFPTPFIMTRYGLAKFDSTTGRDVAWRTTSTGATKITTAHSDEPYPAVVMQSNSLPQFGSIGSTITPEINVSHTMRIDASVDDDMKIRYQTWSHIADLAAAQETLDTNQFSTTDIATLDGLYKGTFTSWFKEATDSGGSYATYADSSGDAVSGGTITRYVSGDIHRTSTARTHAQGTLHKFQLHTLNPIKVFGVNVAVRVATTIGKRP